MVHTKEEAFAIWAPEDARWSEWVVPVAFLHPAPPGSGTAHTTELPSIPVAAAPAGAIVIDLPGAEAVTAGLSLASHGVRPVPLFSGTHGPSAVIDVVPITQSLIEGAERLRRCVIPPDAPPAFLLDSRRNETPIVRAGDYDNRWMALPQDFPSGPLLIGSGIEVATVIQRGSLDLPSDLAHVLRRWQDAGMRIDVVDLASGRRAENAVVPKPSLFKRIWYATIALLGLRRSNVGGFGSPIPEDTDNGGILG